mgnify:CR=1 FL=1
MEKIDLNEYLASNEYPGRGIAVAKAPDGRQMFIGYFIMGRSENSRNRVFDPVPERGGICTMAADPAKLEDPSLIIYNPVLTLGRTHIVTNGDQTDTIYDLMSQGKSFADALRTRTFEPDGPNYTPRISAVVYADGSYQMSILKSADGNGESVQRYFFDYPRPVAGEGRFILRAVGRQKGVCLRVGERGRVPGFFFVRRRDALAGVLRVQTRGDRDGLRPADRPARREGRPAGPGHDPLLRGEADAGGVPAAARHIGKGSRPGRGRK